MERLGWIDFLRGISMILILVFHTEVYYKEYDITPYYIYTTNAIVLFYFISGYLFYRQRGVMWKQKMKSIFRSLLIPYFIFTSLLAIPKLVIRDSSIDYQSIAINILSGKASWFIAALIVAECIFTILLLIIRGKHQWLSTIAVACFVFYFIVPYNQHNYWQWQDALLTFDFLYLGYVFHQYQHFFNTINKSIYSSILLLIFLTIKKYEYHVDLPMRNIAIENIPLFLADVFIWLLFIISIIRYIPRCKMIEWTGRHCIVYYFLAGGCPLIVSSLMNKTGFNFDGYYYRYIVAFILVYALAYVPFIIGRYHK